MRLSTHIADHRVASVNIILWSRVIICRVHLLAVKRIFTITYTIVAVFTGRAVVVDKIYVHASESDGCARNTSTVCRCCARFNSNIRMCTHMGVLWIRDVIIIHSVVHASCFINVTEFYKLLNTPHARLLFALPGR